MLLRRVEDTRWRPRKLDESVDRSGKEGRRYRKKSRRQRAPGQRAGGIPACLYLYRFCVMTAHITYPWAPLTHLARRLLHVPDLVGRPDHTTGAACFALRSNTSSSQSNATWCCRLKLFTWRKASAPSSSVKT